MIKRAMSAMILTVTCRLASALAQDNALLERLERYSQQEITVSEYGEVLVGGFHLHKGRGNIHPVVDCGEAAITLLHEQLQSSVRQKQTTMVPQRLLLLHALRQETSDLELRYSARRLVSFLDLLLDCQDVPTADQLREQGKKIGEATKVDRDVAIDMIRTIHFLQDQPFQAVDHGTIALGPTRFRLSARDSEAHPVQRFGNDVLPYLAASIQTSMYPVRELALYETLILRRSNRIPIRLLNGRVPDESDIQALRSRVVREWHGSAIFEDAVNTWRDVAESDLSAAKQASDGAQCFSSEVQLAIEELFAGPIAVDSGCGLSVSGRGLFGHGEKRRKAEVLRHGFAISPCILSLAGDDPERQLKALVALHALEHKITNIEAQLWMGQTPLAEDVSRSFAEAVKSYTGQPSSQPAMRR